MNVKAIELIRHRFVRIWQSYFPKSLSEPEHNMIHKVLEEPLLSVFYSQPLCDQRHGLLVFEKCKHVFNKLEDEDLIPREQELILASFFHDVAKRFCKFSVTQRVIVATALIFIPNRSHEHLRTSRFKIVRRIGIYVDHAQLSYEEIEEQTNSEFVKIVTLYHHGIPEQANLDVKQLKQIELFIQADTL